MKNIAVDLYKRWQIILENEDMAFLFGNRYTDAICQATEQRVPFSYHTRKELLWLIDEYKSR